MSHLLVSRIKRADCHSPTIAVRWRAAYSNISTGSYQGTIHAGPHQNLQGFVSRVTLGDTAKIQNHSRLRKLDAMGCLVQLELPETDTPQGLGQTLRVW